MNKVIWILWSIVSLALASYFGYTLLYSEDKSTFIVGEASYGHYQIEMSCSTCHTDAFGGEEVLQNACTNCHAQELEEAHDSHPKKKFTDPRDAYRLETIDARYCVSCHVEHQKEQTHEMGLSLPEDYCFHCHTDIAKERESHKDLAFDSCASAGCHNYHDNRALYESFLIKHAEAPWLADAPSIMSANGAARTAIKQVKPKVDIPEISQQFPEVADSWHQQSHGQAGVSCSDCHSDKQETWIEKPGIEQCQSCHAFEAKGYMAGKHGMRLSDALANDLSALTVKNSSLDFKGSAMNAQHGCSSCHSSHSFDTKVAAVDACLNCHNDDHSNNFLTSPHGLLWKQAQRGALAEEQAVSCATCHMPRTVPEKIGTELVSNIESKDGGVKALTGAHQKQAPLIRVEHNQNMNLRPNEKMIRPVCMQCHSLSFSIDALADELLIKSNFNGKPTNHIPSIDWAMKREQR